MKNFYQVTNEKFLIAIRAEVIAQGFECGEIIKGDWFQNYEYRFHTSAPDEIFDVVVLKLREQNPENRDFQYRPQHIWW